MEATNAYVTIMARKPDGTLVKVRKPKDPKSSETKALNKGNATSDRADVTSTPGNPSMVLASGARNSSTTNISLSAVLSPPTTTLPTPAPAVPTLDTPSAEVATDSAVVAGPAPTSLPPQPTTIISPPLAFPVPGILNAVSANADALTAAINNVNASVHALGTAAGLDVSAIAPPGPAPGQSPAAISGLSPYVSYSGGAAPAYVNPQLIATAVTSLITHTPTASTGPGAISGPNIGPAQTQQQQPVTVATSGTSQEPEELEKGHGNGARHELETAAREGGTEVPDGLENGEDKVEEPEGWNNDADKESQAEEHEDGLHSKAYPSGGVVDVVQGEHELPEWVEGMEEVAEDYDKMKDDIPEWEEGMVEVMDEEGPECLEVDDADKILEWEEGMEQIEEDEDEYENESNDEDELYINED